MKKRGTLIVGMEVAYVPYEFFKDGKIIGYDPDIIEYMVGKLGVKAQLVDTAWNGIIPALYAKKFDVIISAMTITKERPRRCCLHAVTRMRRTPSCCAPTRNASSPPMTCPARSSARRSAAPPRASSRRSRRS
ncbi:MAG: transporter substrate-binding domain-containing protein [Acetobacteraceae bacterium]